MSIILGIGGNLGDRLGTLCACTNMLRAVCRIERASSVYETAPMYVCDQPRFLNAVLLVGTELAPLALLGAIHRIERALGRRRQGIPRFGPRQVDIDLICYCGRIMKTKRLTLPHPHLAERAFVMRPLAEIAPAWRHPATGRTAQAVAHELVGTGTEEVTLYAPASVMLAHGA